MLTGIIHHFMTLVVSKSKQEASPIIASIWLLAIHASHSNNGIYVLNSPQTSFPPTICWFGVKLRLVTVTRWESLEHVRDIDDSMLSMREDIPTKTRSITMRNDPMCLGCVSPLNNKCRVAMRLAAKVVSSSGCLDRNHKVCVDWMIGKHVSDQNQNITIMTNIQQSIKPSTNHMLS